MVDRYPSDDPAEEFGEQSQPPAPADNPPDDHPRGGLSPGSRALGRFPTPSLPRGGRPTSPGIPTYRTGTARVPSAPGGPHRPWLPGRGRPTWPYAAGAAAVLILLTLGGVGAAALVGGGDFDAFGRSDPGSPPVASPTPAPSGSSAPPDRLDSRTRDPRPLTVKEVFPGKKLVVADGGPAYQVLKTHSGASCPVAASGDVADLLDRLGCSQVVRATLRTPGGEHLATVGLFNLIDRTSAEQIREQVKPILDQGKGRFRGMAAGDDTEAVARSSARVGWQARGHYLAYCVVARTNGEAIPAGNEEVQEILYDLIELHLNRTVLQRRALGPDAGPSAQPSASRSPAPPRATPKPSASPKPPASPKPSRATPKPSATSPKPSGH